MRDIDRASQCPEAAIAAKIGREQLQSPEGQPPRQSPASAAKRDGVDAFGKMDFDFAEAAERSVGHSWAIG
jgi:hypothetical protein